MECFSDHVSEKKLVMRDIIVNENYIIILHSLLIVVGCLVKIPHNKSNIYSTFMDYGIFIALLTSGVI